MTPRNRGLERTVRAILRGAIPLTAGALLFALVESGDAARPGLTAISEAQAASATYSRQDLLSVETPKEREVRQVREDLFRKIERALSLRQPTSQRADLYLRLAELHLEAYRADFILEGRVFERRLGGARTRGSIDRSQSRPSLRRAIKACDRILALNLAHPRLDEVLFFLGYANDELGDFRAAARQYENIVRRYPDGQPALQAWERLGTLAWDRGDFREAAAQFERALSRDGERESAPAIRHKLAWCQYRLKRFPEAVRSMQRAIADTVRGGERFLSLREEALRDLALFYTEMGKVEEAVAYFESVAGRSDFYALALEKLGRQYERNLEPDKAVRVYEALLATKPGEEASFRVLVKLVDLELRRGRVEGALLRVRGSDGRGGISPRYLANEGSSETQTALQNLRAMVRRAATESHERFRRKSESGALKLSESAYETYLEPLLSAWDPRRETSEIRMYLADVKKELGKTSEAAALYRAVIDSKDERYAREAGALWTAALADELRSGETAPRKGESPRLEPSQKERQFVEAADELYEKLGDTREGREAAVRAAQVLAGYAKTRDDALERAEDLVKKHSGTQQGVVAARLRLQLVSDRLPKDASAIAESPEAGALSRVVGELRANSELMAQDKAAGGRLAAELAEQSTRLEAGAIAMSEKNGDHAAAAKGYLGFARSARTGDAADRAYAGAVEAQLRGDDLAGVAGTLREWKSRSGKQGGMEALSRALALRQFIGGEYKASAESFEFLAGLRSGDARSAALFARASILAGAGESARAVEVLASLLKATSASDIRALARLRLGELLIAQGDSAGAIRLWTEKDASLPAALSGEFALRAALLAGAREDRGAEKKALLGASESGGPSARIGRFLSAVNAVAEKRRKLPKVALPDSALVKAVKARLDFVDASNRSLAGTAGDDYRLQLEARIRASLLALEFSEEIGKFAKANDSSQAAQSAGKFAGSLGSQGLAGLAAVWEKVQSEGALVPELAAAAEGLARQPADSRYLAIGSKFTPRLAGGAAVVAAGDPAQKLSRSRTRLKEETGRAEAWIEHAALLQAQGRTGLASFALDEALALQPGSLAAQADRATLDWIASGAGVGAVDLVRVLRTSEAWEKALAKDPSNPILRENLAGLHGRMRSLGQARRLLDSVPAAARSSASWDLLGAALYSMGQYEEASSGFNAAERKDARVDRFARRYHEALEARRTGGTGNACLQSVQAVPRSGLDDSERAALEALRTRCPVEGGGTP